MKPMLAVILAAVAAPTARAAQPFSDAGFAAALGSIRSAALETGRTLQDSESVSNKERDALLELLADRDAEVRRGALRGLKTYVTQAMVRERVVAVLHDSREDLQVRRQAVKTLSVVGGVSQVREVLLAMGERREEPALRAIAYKALYVQAQRRDIQDRLIDAARGERDPLVRQGAVWALFFTSHDRRVYEVLLDILGSRADEAPRLEALKSLYNGVRSAQPVRDAVTAIAVRRSEAVQMRAAATLALSADPNNRTRDVLLDLARRDLEAEVRRAAVTALDPNNEEILRFFHLPRSASNGLWLDPLDDE